MIDDKKICCFLSFQHITDWPLVMSYSVEQIIRHIFFTSVCSMTIFWDMHRRCRIHSVEFPSMVDPQWNIWYWGSKWNLHTVCWDAVGCEWGTTSVYFGITYVCFIPSRLPVFAVEHQYRHQDFLFLSKVSLEGHIQNLQKFHVGLKFKWGL